MGHAKGPVQPSSPLPGDPEEQHSDISNHGGGEVPYAVSNARAKEFQRIHRAKLGLGLECTTNPEEHHDSTSDHGGGEEPYRPTNVFDAVPYDYNGPWIHHPTKMERECFLRCCEVRCGHSLCAQSPLWMGPVCTLPSNSSEYSRMVALPTAAEEKSAFA